MVEVEDVGGLECRELPGRKVARRLGLGLQRFKVECGSVSANAAYHVLFLMTKRFRTALPSTAYWEAVDVLQPGAGRGCECGRKCDGAMPEMMMMIIQYEQK